MFVISDNLCCDCRKQMKYKKVSIKLRDLSVESFCLYDGINRDMLIQYKELFDEALYPLFFYPIRKYIKKKYHGYVIVDIPSHKSKVDTRGFNHLNRMLEVIDLPHASLFVKTNLLEQKHLSLSQRLENKHHLVELVDVVPKAPILIIDDVCTSGSTLLAVYEKLKGHKYPVKALTFCYHESLVTSKTKVY